MFVFCGFLSETFLFRFIKPPKKSMPPFPDFVIFVAQVVEIFGHNQMQFS